MKLKKSLGQNFFTNPGLADKIVAFVSSFNPTQILEIGPGGGYFTHRLVIITEDLVLIEKDTTLIEELSNNFPKSRIINEDVLDINLSTIPLIPGCVCYGSLPYNVSKKIIQICIESELFSSLCFIIQKEVAEKYTQREGKSSILSIMTKLYADCEIKLNIKPGAFNPPPKVDSSFIIFTPNQNHTKVDNHKIFKELVQRSFSSPRKTLHNNLKNTNFNYRGYELRRAETLNLDDYILIYNQSKMI